MFCLLFVFSFAACGFAADADRAQSEMNESLRAQYGENKRLAAGDYDALRAVKCVNGTFVGKREEGVIACKGIPFAGRQPVAVCRKFAGRQDESVPALRRGEAGSDGL